MLWQPREGYRAGVDAVFLAASCPAKPGESVLELGCGVGTALFCLRARVPGIQLTGIERQMEMAVLAKRNAAELGFEAQIHAVDLATLPKDLRQKSFHHVIANPPYFDRGAGLSSPEAQREASMGEDTPLETWIRVAAKRLRPKGWLTMIHRPERLAELLSGLQEAGLGSVQVLGLQPRQGRDASLVILRARKDGKSPLRLLAPQRIHAGEKHVSDAEDYVPEVLAVLREGAAMPGFQTGDF